MANLKRTELGEIVSQFGLIVKGKTFYLSDPAIKKGQKVEEVSGAEQDRKATNSSRVKIKLDTTRIKTKVQLGFILQQIHD